MQNWKKIIIATLGTFCVSAIVFAVWFFPSHGHVETDPQVGAVATQISAGDIVVVNIFAEEMNDVYGYQFDINYGREYLEYRNRLYSDIDGILTIFAADKEEHLLIGATMVGDQKGYSGQDVPVCRVEFIALSDLDPGQITLSKVNIVQDDLMYLENIGGWTARITTREA